MKKIDISSHLLQDNECVVLITCSKPSKEGKMQVEMSFEGDPTLAAYLIESAGSMINESELIESYS
ncbi:MAG: hypothetical protein EBZ47_04875 [Chlamydiae bacterium]|nr:hypothetical protein [Chlamydiota bacterium]